MIVIGGVLQENPFFVSPDEFLLELRERNTTRNAAPRQRLDPEVKNGKYNGDQAPSELHQ